MGFDLTKENILIVQDTPFGTDTFVRIDDWNASIILDANTPQPGTYAGSILTEWNVEKLNNNGLYEAVNFVPPDGYFGIGDATYSRGPDGRIYEHQTIFPYICQFLPREIFMGRMTDNEKVLWDNFLMTTTIKPDWLDVTPGAWASWRLRYLQYGILDVQISIVERIIAQLFQERSTALLAPDPNLPYDYNPYPPEISGTF